MTESNKRIDELEQSLAYLWKKFKQLEARTAVPIDDTIGPIMGKRGIF